MGRLMVDLAPSEKLTLLRRLDRYRQWASLDDRRLCLECGRVITGRQIVVSGGANPFDVLKVNCPTEGCPSVPMDWSQPENLAEEREGEAEEAADSRLRASPDARRTAVSPEANALAHRILCRAYRAVQSIYAPVARVSGSRR